MKDVIMYVVTCIHDVLLCLAIIAKLCYFMNFFANSTSDDYKTS